MFQYEVIVVVLQYPMWLLSILTIVEGMDIHFTKVHLPFDWEAIEEVDGEESLRRIGAKPGSNGRTSPHTRWIVYKSFYQLVKYQW